MLLKYFSALAHIKTKARNQRILEHDNRSVLPWQQISAVMTTDQHCQTLNHEFRSWPYSCKVNGRIENVCEIQLPIEIKCY